MSMLGLRSTLAALLLGAAATLVPAVDESELEAAIVYNVLMFADWPPEVLATGAPVRLCVAAGGGLAQAMKALQGRDLRGAPMQTQDLGSTPPARPCHAVFVDGSSRPHLSPLLKTLRGGGALIISDDAAAPADDAGVVLSRAGTRYVFDINMQPVKQARVRLSSKLLRLARTVRE
ncbi:YfiR family protein [Piscinibacter terrae]|uniref:YfiR family protein n=1 Tax=Piscinibacter terrae TaxID=2496871 RepID=A0A3N7HQN5_9BURK|nr:YfiR family protein [Albitalea terrae]RQP23081.1 YfiR family protein [Albitalea terrae]